MFTSKQNSAFTLVELIVVIVIISILATIAFLSFSSQSGSARDSTRLTDISYIKKSVEMFNVNAWKYPSPDKSFSFTYSWGTIWNQWILWDTAAKLIMPPLSKKVVDPLDNSEYAYSLATNKREYQVAWNLENPTSYDRDKNPFFLSTKLSILSSPSANALGWTWINVYISWNYNWILLKVSTGSINYYVPTPTLFSLEQSWSTAIYDDTFWSWKDVLPWVNNFANFDSTQVYATWLYDLTSADISNLMDTMKLAYSGSNVTTPAVQELLNASWASLINIWNWLVINALGWKASSVAPVVIWTDWKDLSWASCSKPDVTVWWLTWAWCNSTLWTMNAANVNQYTGICENYNNANAWTTACQSSTATENWAWITAIVSQAPTQTDNIFGKLYEYYADIMPATKCSTKTIWWQDVYWGWPDCPCPSWWHIPSDQEFINLTTSLHWSLCETFIWYQCSGLWWMNQTPSDNIITTLWIPLAGQCYAGTCNMRWHLGQLWTSTHASNSAYIRTFFYGNDQIARQNMGLGSSYSVRCVKDY